MASDLTSHLGYWLRFVSNHVSGAFSRALTEKQVTVPEWVLMRLILDAPARPSTIAESMDFTKGAVSKLADRLIARGLVERSASEDDGRAHLLTLTDAGRVLVPELAGIADANDRNAFDVLEPDERQTLERLLRKIVAKKGLKTVPTS